MAIWPISLLDFSLSELAEVIRTHFSSSLPTHNVQINTSRSVAPPFFASNISARVRNSITRRTEDVY